MPGVLMNIEPEGTVNGAWMPTAVFAADTKVTRDDLQAAFAAENVDARVFFHPLSSLPMFEERRENRNAWTIPTRAINLPSYHDITSAEQDRVVEAIRAVSAGQPVR